jgi:transposase
VGHAHRGPLARSAGRVWALAQCIHALLALEQDRRLGAGIHGRQRGPGSGGGVLRQHGRACPLARRGRPKKHGPQALGRSRGGFGSKVHCVADALGNPLGFTLTGAEQADITQAPALLSQVTGAQCVIADKGYDADALVASIREHGAQAHIPSRSNRKTPRSCDRHRYKARHVIENLFARLKQFRRIATRFEKLASHFLAMITLACICVWMT